MKRYIVFAGFDYYPGGGWDDFAGSFDTLSEAQAAGIADHGDWFQILDTQTWELVNEPTKGDIVKAVASAAGIPCVDIELQESAPEDFLGIPTKD